MMNMDVVKEERTVPVVPSGPEDLDMVKGEIMDLDIIKQKITDLGIKRLPKQKQPKILIL